jgi:hypothetical protein
MKVADIIAAGATAFSAKSHGERRGGPDAAGREHPSAILIGVGSQGPLCLSSLVPGVHMTLVNRPAALATMPSFDLWKVAHEQAHGEINRDGCSGVHPSAEGGEPARR